MCRALLAIVAVFLFVLPTPAAEKPKQNLEIKSISFRAVPWENTSYIPGQSNTTCYGSGTDWGYTTDVTVNCGTVTSPDIPIMISKLFVYNQVESADYRYSISCTRNWVGSECWHLTVGETYDAEESGSTLNVYAYTSYNDKVKGKLSRIKFDITNKTPKSGWQEVTTDTPSNEPAKVKSKSSAKRTAHHNQFSLPEIQDPTTTQSDQANSWSQEPTGFRGIDFGMAHEEAKQKVAWVASECPVLNAKFVCMTQHLIGGIPVRSILNFSNGFGSVVITFDPASYEVMKTIFIEKYGQPHWTPPNTAKQRPDIMWTGKIASVTLFQDSALITTNEATKRSIKDAADDF